MKNNELPVLQVKKMLSELTSANLELIIIECVKKLRIETYREANNVFRASIDPKTIELLKKELGAVK